MGFSLTYVFYANCMRRIVRQQSTAVRLPSFYCGGAVYLRQNARLKIGTRPLRGILAAVLEGIHRHLPVKKVRQPHDC